VWDWVEEGVNVVEVTGVCDVEREEVWRVMWNVEKVGFEIVSVELVRILVLGFDERMERGTLHHCCCHCYKQSDELFGFECSLVVWSFLSSQNIMIENILFLQP